VYHYFTALENVTTLKSLDIIWQKAISLKVNFFAWRLLRNFIATTYNHLRQVLLQNQQQLWAGGCESNENVNHLFLHYNFFGSIRILVSLLLGYVMANPTLIIDHLHQLSSRKFIKTSFSYVKKETAEFSSTSNILCINCSTKLSYQHFDDWKRNTIFSLLIAILGG